jgi:hypothetical protein
MCGHVVQLARAVAGYRDDLAGPHDYRADGYFAALARRFRLAERARHVATTGVVHLASPAPLC